MDDRYTQLAASYLRAKRRRWERDLTMSQIRLVREGRMSDVAPGLFPDAGPWQEPIIANMIDVAARDTAEMIAPLPTVSCKSPSMIRQSDQDRADTRTKIVQAIACNSDLQVQMYTGADNYISYAFLPGVVETDYERDLTTIRLLDPLGTYFDEDRFGRLVTLYNCRRICAGDAADLYPEVARAARYEKGDGWADHDLELLTVWTKTETVVMVLGLKNPMPLSVFENKVGKILARVAKRPGPLRGQFDDVLWVQLAKAQFAALGMQAAHDSVNSPLAVPDDVNDIPLGPGSIISSNNPGAIGKVNLNVPREVYTQQSLFDSEQRIGSRYPETRTGNVDASVITGRGVQALEGTLDNQVRTAQAVLADWMVELFSLALEYEEARYGSRKRSANGTNSGVPFKVDYVPSNDIRGDYTVSVRYGLMAGLDPSRWLVFGLQAQNGGLVSKDFLRREIPADFDPEEQERLIDLERLNEAGFQALAGYAQAIPVIAQGGQDPAEVVAKLVAVAKLRERGSSIVQALEKVFPLLQEQPQAPGMPGEAGPGGGTPDGLSANGLLRGVAPGQAGEMPGGRPDLLMALSRLDSSGNPSMSVSTSTRRAV